ncbi:HAMP domain-containing protein [Heliobacterium gestii]|uniref:HAMP domain-containing protein n=1 Tax=Heliomicrobium gestii TaxID=2699 RepID=A0A845LGW6_HELGE|nr:methyl-accepting chemotaxis protein [Heliomicrobium gestii]MBM7865951.1 methyl-accepting chemotaxis protein [Heliomicrobium gestii]MZP42713.1 HAMP domain-containing protein [Heliomicrobium gestii]
MKSIKAKLILFFFLSMTVAIGSIAGIVYMKAKDVFLTQLKQSMMTQSEVVANNIGSWLDDTEKYLETLGLSPIRTLSPEQVEPYLKSELKRNKDLFALLYGTPDGKSTVATVSPTNVSDRDYFQKAMKTGKIAMSSPVISKSLGKPVINFNYPIQENGKIIGWAGGGITLDRISEQIASYKIGQNGYAFLLDNNGTVIAHPNKELNMKVNYLKDEGVNQPLKDLSKQIVGGEPGVALYRDESNQEHFVAFRPVPGADWSVAVSLPASEVLGPLNAMMATFLWVTLLLLALVAATTYYFSNRFTEPILQLRDHATQISQGDLSHNFEQMETQQDEVGELAKAFKEMMANLREVICNVQEHATQVSGYSKKMVESSVQTVKATQQIAITSQEVALGAHDTVQRTIKSSESNQRLALSIRLVTERTEAAARRVNDAFKYAEDGRETLERVNHQMRTIQSSVNESSEVVKNLGQRSQAIGQIVEVISNIASQTNMLALNAAIEAARAGEQGRGFAVVADEVRKLAEQSGAAANEIRHLIEEIQVRTQEAVRTMASGTSTVEEGSKIVVDVNRFFEAIVESINNVLTDTKQALSAVKEIAQNGDQIADEIEAIKDIAQRSSAGTENVAAATQEQVAIMEEIQNFAGNLGDMSERLAKLVHRFQV